MQNDRMPKKELLFETHEGTVRIERCEDKLQIEYGNVSIQQSLTEFNYFSKAINSLYGYINDVRQLYYKKFLIQLSQYRLSLVLNSKEIIDLYELLAGAKTMLDLEKIIEDALQQSSDKGKENL